MRKDAKIGFAIGGVLLAVLTVYVIVVPRHHPANGVTLATGPGGTEQLTPPPVSTDRNSDSTTPLATNAQKPELESAKPADNVAKNDNVNWAKLLGGAADVPPMMSSNPSATDSPAPLKDNTTAANTPDTNTAPPVNPPVNLSAFAPNNPPAVITLATPATQPASSHLYTIKPGQTLMTIAGEVYGNQRFYVAIIRANPTVNPNRLKVGSRIVLPDISDVRPEATVAGARETTAVNTASTATANTYKVASGDNLYRIATKLFGSPKLKETIYQLNKDAIGPDESKLKLGMILKLPSAPTVTVTAAAR